MTSCKPADIEQKARDLINRARLTGPPVQLEELVKHLGLLMAANLGDEISGVLVVKEGAGIIGYNRDQARVRQRFTIAHEMGHFILHHAAQNLFIDRSATSVFHRDQSSSTGDRALEVQANQFAAALLMPSDFIAEELRNAYFRDDEEMISALAQKFVVSEHAMSLRLSRLGHVSPNDEW